MTSNLLIFARVMTFIANLPKIFLTSSKPTCVNGTCLCVVKLLNSQSCESGTEVVGDPKLDEFMLELEEEGYKKFILFVCKDK